MDRIHLIPALVIAMLAASPAWTQSGEDGGEEEVQTLPNPEELLGAAPRGVVLPGGGLLRVDPSDPSGGLVRVGPNPEWTDFGVRDPGVTSGVDGLDPEAGSVVFGDGASGRRPPTGEATGIDPSGVVTFLVAPAPDAAPILLVPDPQAKGNDMAIETLELVHEGLEIVELAGVAAWASSRSGVEEATLSIWLTSFGWFVAWDEAGDTHAGSWYPIGEYGAWFQ